MAREERSMGLPAEKIIAEALRLPTQLRALLAERLIESLDLKESGEVSPEWREEIIRRCKEIDEGLTELIPAEVVMLRAYSALK
jgi:putative addiction module component (TIGR02574 family)